MNSKNSLPRAASRRVGFTLIELLVVVAIIGILAAILFSVFSKARSRAREASSTSNLKQIGLAIQQYVQDYDQRTPIIATMFDRGAPIGATTEVNSAVFTDPQSPIVVLGPYTKSQQIFRHVGAVNGMKDGVGQHQPQGDLNYRFMGWDAPYRFSRSQTLATCTTYMGRGWHTDTVLNGQHMDSTENVLTGVEIYGGDASQRTVARDLIRGDVSPKGFPHTDGILLYLKLDGHMEKRKVGNSPNAGNWQY